MKEIATTRVKTPVPRNDTILVIYEMNYLCAMRYVLYNKMIDFDRIACVNFGSPILKIVILNPQRG